MRPKSETLTGQELEIMKVIWRSGQATVREVYEEAGLVVEVHGLLDLLFVCDDPRKPANVAVYLCRAIGGALRPGDEETEAAWFRLDALPAEIGFDNYPRILERLRHAGGYPESPWTRLQKLLNGDARSP